MIIPFKVFATTTSSSQFKKGVRYVTSWNRDLPRCMKGRNPLKLCVQGGGGAWLEAGEYVDFDFIHYFKITNLPWIINRNMTFVMTQYKK